MAASFSFVVAYFGDKFEHIAEKYTTSTANDSRTGAKHALKMKLISNPVNRMKLVYHPCNRPTGATND